jgi:hypothetical protein
VGDFKGGDHRLNRKRFQFGSQLIFGNEMAFPVTSPKPA